MTPETSWPGSIRTSFRIIDWSRSAQELHAFINEKEAPVAVTFLWGAKVAISQVRILDESRDPHNPGDILAVTDGPIRVATGDRILEVGQYAVEPAPDHWDFHNRLAAFTSRFEDLIHTRGLRFSPSRWDDFKHLLTHCAMRHCLGPMEEEPIPTREAFLGDAVGSFAINLPWLRNLFARCGLAPGDRILDVGCFNVWFPLIARDLGFEAWGCDLFEPEHFTNIADWLHYFRADVADFPPFPQKVDFVCVRGLTPLIYARHFDIPELNQFRDRILEGLSDRGSVYISLQSRNTGSPQSENDWGNKTVEDLHAWMGRHFPYSTYSRIASRPYTALLASRRPLVEPWQGVTLGGMPLTALSEEAIYSAWEEYLLTRMDPIQYRMLLLRLSQKFWSRPEKFNGGPVFVLGGSPMAEDLADLMQKMQDSLKVLGHGTACPADLPPETFLFCLPDAVLSDSLPFPHVRISHTECLGRMMADDLYSVGGDYDYFAVKGHLEKEKNGLIRSLDGARKQIQDNKKEFARLRKELENLHGKALPHTVKAGTHRLRRLHQALLSILNKE